MPVSLVNRSLADTKRQECRKTRNPPGNSEGTCAPIQGTSYAYARIRGDEPLIIRSAELKSPLHLVKISAIPGGLALDLLGTSNQQLSAGQR